DQHWITISVARHLDTNELTFAPSLLIWARAFRQPLLRHSKCSHSLTEQFTTFGGPHLRQCQFECIHIHNSYFIICHRYSTLTGPPSDRASQMESRVELMPPFAERWVAGAPALHCGGVTLACAIDTSPVE